VGLPLRCQPLEDITRKPILITDVTHSTYVHFEHKRQLVLDSGRSLQSFGNPPLISSDIGINTWGFVRLYNIDNNKGTSVNNLDRRCQTSIFINYVGSSPTSRLPFSSRFFSIRSEIHHTHCSTMGGLKPRWVCLKSENGFPKCFES